MDGCMHVLRCGPNQRPTDAVPIDEMLVGLQTDRQVYTAARSGLKGLRPPHPRGGAGVGWSLTGEDPRVTRVRSGARRRYGS